MKGGGTREWHMPDHLFDTDPALHEEAEALRAQHRESRRAGDQQHGEVTLRRGEVGDMQKLEWLWNGWLAAGKLHILAGMKGAGKTTAALDLLAQITVGGKWPDGTQAPLGDVLVWSGEDDIRDTILPRIYAASGDVTRVVYIGDVIVNGVKRGFDPGIDLPGLIKAARQIPDLKAIMIDPVVSIGTGDSHKNAETRRGLQPLVDLGNEKGAAIIGITHFTKNTQGRDPIERVTGSLAYGALPRVVWAAAHGENEDSPRKFVRIASNIGRCGGGFEYLLYQEPLTGFDFSAQRALWGKALSGTPAELLGDAHTRSQKLSAIKFLEDILASGPVPVNDIKAAATAHSLSWPTVERAKAKIGNIVAEQREKKWWWAKPAPKGEG